MWPSYCLSALAALRIADPLPVQELRVRVFDLFQVLHPREATERPVVIVDIDEKSLRAIGQWPWPRTRVADLITRLTQMGALVIAFDIVFAEPDRMSPSVAAEAFRDLDEATRTKLRALPSNDSVLADALRQSHVVLGKSGLPFAVPQPEGTQPPIGLATMGGDPRRYLLNFPGLLRNVPLLEQAASGRGLFTIRAERDGIVRRVPIVMQAQGAIMPSLTLEMLRVVSGSNTVLIRSDHAGVQNASVPGFVIPTDRNGQLWIHFAPHDAARYVSAADVLDGRVPPERVARRLVLIGTSAVGLLDSKTTPIDPVMPGVEVHAQVLENVLTNSVLSSPNYAIGVELCAALLLGIAIIWLAPILSPALLLLFGVAIVAVTVGASWYFYLQNRLLFDFTYPLLSSALVYLTLVFSNYISEQAQRRRIRSAFGQYLSPALVEQLAHSPEKLVLGGEEREMSILFSDVRGFTTISELYKNDPQGLTSLMNSFLTPLTNAIIEHKGTIDKYMGDAVMAFWNAPLNDVNHEHNACEAALEMLSRVETSIDSASSKPAKQASALSPSKLGSASIPGNASSEIWGQIYGSTIRCLEIRSIWPRGCRGNQRTTAFLSSSVQKQLQAFATNLQCWSSIASRLRARPNRNRFSQFSVARTLPAVTDLADCIAASARCLRAFANGILPVQQIQLSAAVKSMTASVLATFLIFMPRVFAYSSKILHRRTGMGFSSWTPSNGGNVCRPAS